MQDLDGDGYGSTNPPSQFDAGTDCDDQNAGVNPNASELCDGLDNDCDTEIDELGAIGSPEWYVDSDGDGYGNPNAEPYAKCVEEGPLGRYTLTHDFYMMTTEVTQGMYEEFTGENPSGFRGFPDRPLENLQWIEAANFANALSVGESLDRCYDDQNDYSNVAQYSSQQIYDCPGYRLPTEAEWEYAARSGSTGDMWTPNGGGSFPLTFQCSNQTIDDGTTDYTVSDFGWYCFNTSGTTQTVAQLRPNGFGLYDMHGNVYEMCHDWYSNTFPYTSIDPFGLATGTTRVRRNSHYSNTSYYLHVGYRSGSSITSTENKMGFRLVRTANP